MSTQSRETVFMRIAKWASVGLALLALLVIVLAVAAYCAVRASLPQLDGARVLAGLGADVRVTRDAAGTATIVAASTLDATRVLGFLHAQERFFEMDLARRSAAGELAELLGPALIDADKKKRLHRFRQRLEAEWQRTPADRQAQFAAYREGVNAGLAALPVRPWQYLALRSEPRPWQEIDSLLVIAEMTAMLQLQGVDNGFYLSMLRDRVKPAAFAWLKPVGGEWDAPLDGSRIATAPLPGADAIDTRRANDTAPSRAVAADDANTAVGSNNWAVGGALTANGAGILVNDMHLGLGVPNIWYRAQIEIGAASARPSLRLAGVTLPGLPALTVVGSNGRIAWGFTNSYGRWHDWVRVPDGTPTQRFEHEIKVKGQASVTFAIDETAIGPIVPREFIASSARRGDAAAKPDAKADTKADAKPQPDTKTATDQPRERYALSWVAHWPGGITADVASIQNATTLDEALATAHTVGMPHQNFVAVDAAGNLAWTIAGRMPLRGTASMAREAFADYAAVATSHGQWLPLDRVPVVRNPANHRIWTANGRVVGGEAGGLVGHGGYDLGARGTQIRDRLLERERFDEAGALAIQYDAEARFLSRWRPLLVASLERLAARRASGAETAGRQLREWNGRADREAVGYHLLRAWRVRLIDACWKAWVTAAVGHDGLPAATDGTVEYALWQAVNERPAHLLPRPHKTWDALLDAEADALLKTLIERHGDIDKATWGSANATNIRHPFARLVPALGPYLNMPARPQAGDTHMPAVAAPAFGASQRLAVSPGREQQGILSMPGGQSGHPLSPFYGAGHEDWLAQRPVPLLAGETRHQLQLTATAR